MDFKWVYTLDEINFNDLSQLYKIAPLGDKKSYNLQTVFKNSIFKCFVFHNSILVGAGRALADGFDTSYICDVVIHPDYQGKGIGKDIINQLKTFSKDHKKIILYANIGKEAFYKKLGFKQMNTAMAIFQDETQAIKNGFILDESQ